MVYSSTTLNVNALGGKPNRVFTLQQEFAGSTPHTEFLGLKQALE